jgi:hypothetical protein
MTTRSQALVEIAIQAEAADGPLADALRSLAAAATGPSKPITTQRFLGADSGSVAVPLADSMLVLLVEDTGNFVDPIIILMPPNPAIDDAFTVKTIGSQHVQVDGNGKLIEGLTTVNLNTGFVANTFRAMTFAYSGPVGTTPTGWHIVWDYRVGNVVP